MEITIDTVISLLGLFIGGGGGAFFTWRWMRRKAKAEARTPIRRCSKTSRRRWTTTIGSSLNCAKTATTTSKDM